MHGVTAMAYDKNIIWGGGALSQHTARERGTVRHGTQALACWLPHTHLLLGVTAHVHQHHCWSPRRPCLLLPLTLALTLLWVSQALQGRHKVQSRCKAHPMAGIEAVAGTEQDSCSRRRRASLMADGAVPALPHQAPFARAANAGANGEARRTRHMSLSHHCPELTCSDTQLCTSCAVTSGTCMGVWKSSCVKLMGMRAQARPTRTRSGMSLVSAGDSPHRNGVRSPGQLKQMYHMHDHSCIT